MTEFAINESNPYLRTLAPLLRGLEQKLREWVSSPRNYPINSVLLAEIEGTIDDIHHKVNDLDVERPLLVVVMMGGTGVGKSTLLNALAGSAIANASITRPTTFIPVVYAHRTISKERLAEPLKNCVLIHHDRIELLQKLIIDTPDLDSNDLSNRQKLLEVLPVADIVLYVGSQEKYHDQIGWELFKEQRLRCAFAFVLNKWDRCVGDFETSGTRPDLDFLADLRQEGFSDPRLFRTSAQSWLDAARRGSHQPEDLPGGEQFDLLKQWLESGLTRLEIEAVKARGVFQILNHAVRVLLQVMPPDLRQESTRVREAWTEEIREEAETQANVLLGTLEAHQHEIEQHFSMRGQQRFRGLMSGYLRLTTLLRYTGFNLRDRVSLSTRVSTKTPTKSEIGLENLALYCSHNAGDRVLMQRMTALVNRLLLRSEKIGFPLLYLNSKVEDLLRIDWKTRHAGFVTESLTEVENEVSHPQGMKRYIRGTVSFLGNVLPEAVLVASIIALMWQFFINGILPNLFHALLPVYMTVATLVGLHLLILVTLPIRWTAIRGEFEERLRDKIMDEFTTVILTIPESVSHDLIQARKHVEYLVTEIHQIQDWMKDRELAVQISDLYGK